MPRDKSEPRPRRPAAWPTHSRAWLRASARVLIVEDDVSIVTQIRVDLERDGYGVLVANTAAEMRRAVDAFAIDLVILDAILPDEDGWGAFSWLRSRAIPVIILTGKGRPIEDEQRVRRSPDARLTKLPNPRELLTPQRKIRWRAASVPAEAAANGIRFAEWMLDVTNRRLTSSAGRVVKLTRSELRVLLLLTRNPDRIITRDQLMHLIAGCDWKPHDHRIITHIRNLRRKIDLDTTRSSLIRTLHGGYMFVPARESVAPSCRRTTLDRRADATL
jgi:DNA-binding response OmpR family regulator